MNTITFVEDDNARNFVYSRRNHCQNLYVQRLNSVTHVNPDDELI